MENRDIGLDGGNQNHLRGVHPFVKGIVHHDHLPVRQLGVLLPHLLGKSPDVHQIGPQDDTVGRKGTPMAPAMNRRVIWKFE